MPQIFHPSMNTISRVSIFGAVFILAGLILLAGVIVRSSYVTGADVIRVQPVEFSHQHHVSDCGIDCRYCHTSVEDSHFAGIPATEICMNCHAHLWRDAPILEPVRASFRANEPLKWTRVHDVPDFCYFNHSIHVAKGIGCIECHGKVDEMPLMWQEATLHMEWCLDCHRQPEKRVRPREFVYEMLTVEELAETEEFKTYLAREFPEHQPENFDLGKFQKDLAERYGLRRLTNCSNCHW